MFYVVTDISRSYMDQAYVRNTKRRGELHTMTIGEKIKYFRKQRGITQGELAELTGIHPVSIRKYETNKMQPLPPQVEKIAAALNVNFSAIYGMDQSAFRLETRGDLMGLLMTAYKAGLIQVDGPKDRYGAFKEEQCCIRLLPVLSQYFAVAGQEDENRNMLPALKVTDSSVLSDFIRWEGLYREGYLKDQELLTKGNSSEDEKYVADDFREMLEQIELDLHVYAGFRTFNIYSSSIVPGGLLVRSYSTRFTPLTSLMIRVMHVCSTLQGISHASAVIKSVVRTALSTTA